MPRRSQYREMLSWSMASNGFFHERDKTQSPLERTEENILRTAAMMREMDKKESILGMMIYLLLPQLEKDFCSRHEDTPLGS